MARQLRRPQLALAALLVAIGIGYAVNALTTHHSATQLATTNQPVLRPQTSQSSTAVALSALPAQAARVVAEIQTGGPFAYPNNDGVVFDNNERLLPGQPHGYYHEYTVPTPGAPDRGARRLVTGSRGEYYYTGDHYAHFQQVDLSR